MTLYCSCYLYKNVDIDWEFDSIRILDGLREIYSTTTHFENETSPVKST